MRTTLSIDDEVLAAAKALAKHQERSVGEVISELARRSLRQSGSSRAKRNGIPVLSQRPDVAPVTLEIVNSLRDDGA